jgi:succinate dehydrogenase / fumarate reductase, membrane anchor subunit
MSLGAAKHWLVLRVTAIAAIPLCVWLVWSMVSLADADHAAFTGWLKNPLHAVLMILFVTVNFWHAMLGTHEIIEDYVHDKTLLNLSLKLKCAAFGIIGAVCVLAVVKVAFL